MKLAAPLIFLILTSQIGQSQTLFPESGWVFSDHSIPVVEILIEGQALSKIFRDPGSDQLYPATCIFSRDDRSDTIPQVGFRLRGNTSRGAKKKSFKVSFNSLVPGRNYYGLDKMNLNGEHNDPTIMRSKLGWDLLRELEVPASRSNHVELWINGEYYGLYLNVEHIDEEFTRSHFGSEEGVLYKCDHPENLRWHDADSLSYPDCKVKQSSLKASYPPFLNFVKTLNLVSDEDFKCELEAIFEVDEYLRILAFEVIAGHWDSPSFNSNNLYLWYDSRTGLMHYIPFDLDNSHGISWLPVAWIDRDVNEWFKGAIKPNRLMKRVLAQPEYYNRYLHYVELIVREIWDEDWMQEVERLKNQMDEAVARDQMRTKDYGFSLKDYERAFHEGVRRAVPVGLLEYMEGRKKSALQQSKPHDPGLICSNLMLNVEADSVSLQRVRAEVWLSEPETFAVSVQIRSEDELYVLPMSPGESLTFSQQWTVDIPISIALSNFQYKVLVLSEGGAELTRWPCIARSWNADALR